MCCTRAHKHRHINNAGALLYMTLFKLTSQHFCFMSSKFECYYSCSLSVQQLHDETKSMTYTTSIGLTNLTHNGNLNVYLSF